MLPSKHSVGHTIRQTSFRDDSSVYWRSLQAAFSFFHSTANWFFSILHVFLVVEQLWNLSSCDVKMREMYESDIAEIKEIDLAIREQNDSSYMVCLEFFFFFEDSFFSLNKLKLLLAREANAL